MGGSHTRTHTILWETAPAAVWRLVCTVKDSARLEAAELAWTRHGTWVGRVQPLLALMETADGARSGAPSGRRRGPCQPLRSSAVPLGDDSPIAERGERTHLKGTEPPWTQTSGLLLQHVRTWLCPREQWQPLSTALAQTWERLQHLHLPSLLLPGGQLWVHPERTCDHAHFRSSSPTKVTGYLQSVQGHSHVNILLQDQDR